MLASTKSSNTPEQLLYKKNRSYFKNFDQHPLRKTCATELFSTSTKCQPSDKFWEKRQERTISLLLRLLCISLRLLQHRKLDLIGYLTKKTRKLKLSTAF